MKIASYEIAVDAPPEVVWRCLTTAEGLVRWVGPEAAADPVPGGGLRWVHPEGATVIGRFVELAPHRRLVFTYGWQDGRMGASAGSTTVEIELSEDDGVITLRLTHRGLPPAAVEDHERGWAYILSTLRDAIRSGTTS